MTAPNENALTREEVQKWPPLGPMNLEPARVLALLADRDELRRELEVCASEAKALGEQVQRLERERDELSQLHDIEVGRRHRAEAHRTEAEAERDAATAAMDNLARKLTATEAARDTERARVEKAELKLAELQACTKCDCATLWAKGEDERLCGDCTAEYIVPERDAAWGSVVDDAEARAKKAEAAAAALRAALVRRGCEPDCATMMPVTDGEAPCNCDTGELLKAVAK